MIRIAVAFNIGMFLWVIYETLLAAGFLGPTPSLFPMGPNFRVLAALTLWGVGDFILIITVLIRRRIRK